MDPENFNKIRSAVREVATTIMQQEGRVGVVLPPHVHQAFAHFRQVKNEKGPNALHDDISYWSAMREMRNKMGDEKFELFINITEEYWGQMCQRVLIDSRSRITAVEPGEQRMALARELYVLAIKECDTAVRADPRIRKAFSKNQDLLDEAQATMTKVFQPIFERDLAVGEFQKSGGSPREKPN